MTLLIQDAAGKIVVSLEDTGGNPAEDLETTDIQVDLKKDDEVFFTNKVLTAPTNATASIGGGADGTVNLSILGGTVGNSYTVEVTVPAGTSSLDVTKSGTTLTIDLSVSGGVPVPAENTATLVAAAINDLDSEISATASGTGADPLTSAEGPTSFTGGVDGDWTELGAGSYQLDLSTTDTDTLGDLFVRVSGTTIRTIIESAIVATTVSPTPTPTLTIPTTAIFGYVRDAGGSGVSGATVGVRVLSQPTVLHPDTDGLVLTSELITTTTDSDGFFTLDLVTGSQVDMFIPSASYRRTFTVPAVSTNIFDLP